MVFYVLLLPACPSYGGAAMVALGCSSWFLWLAGLFAILLKFRPLLVVATAAIAAVIIAAPTWGLLVDWLAPLPPAPGIDLQMPSLFEAAVAAAAAGGVGMPAWAMDTRGSGLAVASASQTDWLNAHGVQFVPSFNALPGGTLALGQGANDTTCTVEAVVSDDGSNSAACTVAAVVAALENTKTVMRGPGSLPAPACDSCFGAERDSNHCCNSCRELAAAYDAQGWDAGKVSGFNSPQCRREQHLAEHRGTAVSARSRGSGFGRNTAVRLSHLLGWRHTAGIDPVAAARVWTQLVQPAAAATGLALVSPATGVTPAQVQWTGEFVKACYLGATNASCGANASDGGGGQGVCDGTLQTCDISRIAAWAVVDGSNRNEPVDWFEQYGGDRDGDFQRALAHFLDGASMYVCFHHRRSVCCSNVFTDGVGGRNSFVPSLQLARCRFCLVVVCHRALYLAAIPCTASDASRCYDWAGFVASRPIWLVATGCVRAIVREPLSGVRPVCHALAFSVGSQRVVCFCVRARSNSPEARAAIRRIPAIERVVWPTE